MLEIILALVALGILVLVHEMGHFIVARWCGVKILAFSIGFGKPFYTFNRSGIEYRLSWIPLGGYVKMKGEALEEDAPVEPDSFQYISWWKKALIGFAGPAANFIFGLLIFIIAFALPSKMQDQAPVVGKSQSDWTYILMPADSIISINNQPVRGWTEFLSQLKDKGENTVKLNREGHTLTMTLPAVNVNTFSTQVLPRVPAMVGEVVPGQPAWQAGIRNGDIIQAVNGIPIRDWYEMRSLITNSSAASVALRIKRGNETLDKTIALEANPLSDKERYIGIMQPLPVTYTVKGSPATALSNGTKGSLNFLALNYVGLYKVFSKPDQLKSSIGGPITLVSLSSQSARKGWNYWILFIGSISFLLMIMNLLPIPVLDGGHIMFAFIQAITGKPLTRNTQIILQNIGLVLLVALMLLAFYNDITRVLSRFFLRQ